MTRTFLVGILIAGALAGCADSIRPATSEVPDAGGSAPDDGTPAAPAGKVQTTRAADGTYTTIVDSTSMTAWTYVDLETGAEAAISDPWDLRFQRFHILSNGGVTGSGGVMIAPVTGTTLAQLTAPPASGYVADAADGNGDGVADSAFEQGDGWYSYDPASHVLTPQPVVWIIKTDGGATLALEIVSYYDAVGTAGWFKLHWRPL